MPIDWTDEALLDIQQIFDGLAARSPHFAGRFLERITAQVENVQTFPRLGKVVEEFGFQQIREIIIPPYRVMYRITPTGIEVITVTYGSSRPRPDSQ